MRKVGIVGATGYTGMELLRIILGHGGTELTYATSRSWAGRRVQEALPHIGGKGRLVMELFDPGQAASRSELVFLCLPHGESASAASALLKEGVKVVDLSADFRIRDPAVYRQWYAEHGFPELLPKAVNGFPEIYRERIREADLIANPGCYPTSIVLGLLPLVEKGMVVSGSIVADSKSGVSGAGREPKAHLHFPEVEGNFSAYNIAGKHRHTCEIEQELGRLAGEEVKITFTPHLLPVSRGILSSIYCSVKGKAAQDDLVRVFQERYATEPFVRVRTTSEPLPDLKSVRGTNLCIVAPRLDPRTGRVVVISCIDNLVKGAAGQAVQNMNIMMGLPETSGLEALPVVP